MKKYQLVVKDIRTDEIVEYIGKPRDTRRELEKAERGLDRQLSLDYYADIIEVDVEE
jgi:hypothetical protein